MRVKKGEARRAEQYYKREADWKKNGEERSDERAGIMSDLLLAWALAKVSAKSALYYIIHMFEQIWTKIYFQNIWLFFELLQFIFLSFSIGQVTLKFA